MNIGIGSRGLLGLALVVGLMSQAGGKEPDAAGVEFFEKKIRPLLTQHCYKCHSQEAGKGKGGLFLDTQAGLTTGGESGAAVAPGDVDGSLLIEAVRHEGLEMPPEEKLPAEAIALLEQWVAMGAPDPRTGKAVVKKPIDLEEAKQFWSFQPPVKHPTPQVQQPWAQTTVDRFLQSKWESMGLSPTADADRPTLLRRLHFVLTGLPPSVEEQQAFANDSSPEAVQRVVDRLLASPQFGERWGRHWLDVARYAESTGKERNVGLPFAWRYRDYVIDAVNADKPFDQFIREQLAGDLLPGGTVEEKRERQIATGFLALGPRSLNERNRLQYTMDEIDEQIDVSTRAFLGLTVSCARCHDHKFDPVTTGDYHALAGIFLSSSTKPGVGAGRGNNYAGELVDLPAAPASDSESRADVEKAAKAEKLKSELALKLTEFDKLRATAKKLKNNPKKANKKNLSPKEARALLAEKTAAVKKEAADLQSQLDKLGDAAKTPRDVAMGVVESKPTDCRIYARGEVSEPGPTVPRGFPAVLTYAGSPKIPASSSGRLEFAQWIADPRNPLTARVAVNRAWSHVFGAGLTPGVDNFGMLGERPSHPELLDVLAVEFMEEGWSLKTLIRKLVLSRAFQLSSDHHAGNYTTDPDNRFVWRMNRRRLDAESLRDSMLAASGLLNLVRPNGSPVAATVGSGELGRNVRYTDSTASDAHRGVYLPLFRGYVPEMLTLFDVADPNLVVGQRETTTVATQALFLMNSSFILDQSQALARRVRNGSGSSESAAAESSIDAAFRLTLCRPASESERRSSLRFLSEFPGTPDEAWSSLCQALMASGEFRYVY